MSQSIQRKPVPSEIDVKQVPKRVSSKKAKTQPILDESVPPEDAKLDASVQNMQYLAPLVSRLEIGESPDSDVSDVRTVRPDQATTWPFRPIEAIPGMQSASRINDFVLDKPLPKPPEAETDANEPVDHLQGLQAHPGVRPSAKLRARSERTLQQSKITADDLDLSNTEDTRVHTKWAPAVTHETIQQNIHQVNEQRITREYHEHHVFHRILPIYDVEVLPAKHYVEINGRLQEVSEDQLPICASSSSKNAQRLVAESYKKTLPENSSTPGKRQFTARSFPNTEGDYKEHVSPTGSTRTERWWVHQPRLEKGAEDSGQTRPFHFGSSDPANDGFRGES